LEFHFEFLSGVVCAALGGGMGGMMIYIFSFTIIYTLIRQKEKLLSKKRNLFIYLILSIIGITLGVIYLMNPYVPSITSTMEKYMK